MTGVWATITILLLGFFSLVIQLKKIQRQQRYLETQQYDMWNQLGQHEKELKQQKAANEAE